MPWKPFDAIEANLDRLLAAFSDEEIRECREVFTRRCERLLAELDQPNSGERTVLTKTEAIERYGTAALTLNALVRGGDPSCTVILAGEDLSRRRDPRLSWQLKRLQQVPGGRAH